MSNLQMPQKGQEHPSHRGSQREVHGTATLVASVEGLLKLWILGPESGAREGFSVFKQTSPGRGVFCSGQLCDSELTSWQRRISLG